MLIGFAANVLVREVRGSEQRVPVERRQDAGQLVGVEAGRECPADQAAHAGPGHQVDRHSMLFEPANDSDVSEAAGAAAAKCHANTRPPDHPGNGTAACASREAV